MIKITKLKQIKEYNLDGYKHILNNKWNYPRELDDYLVNNGFEVIGEGLFSAVYSSKTENFVVKVNKGVIDQEFVQFVDYCRSNKSPHFPKFGKIRRFENDEGDEFYVIMAEKLEPVNEHESGYKIARFLFEMHHLLQNGEINDYIDEDNWEGLFDEYADDELNDSDRNQIKQIIELLESMSGRFNMQKLDLSEFNFMMRGNTVVLIDPFGSRHDHPNPEDALWYPEILDKMMGEY